MDCRRVIAHFDPAETRASAARATRFAAILEMAVICVIGGDESFQVTTRERGRSRRAGAAPDSVVLSHYLRFFLSAAIRADFLDFLWLYFKFHLDFADNCTFS